MLRARVPFVVMTLSVAATGAMAAAQPAPYTVAKGRIESAMQSAEHRGSAGVGRGVCPEAVAPQGSSDARARLAVLLADHERRALRSFSIAAAKPSR